MMINNEADEKLKEIVELSLLYDFYGDLLKDHSKDIFEDYILNDYSLSEIAERINISRQGVHDIVKRCSEKLKGFERKLHLVYKYNEQHRITTKIIQEISQIIEIEQDPAIKERLSKIQELVEKI